MESAHVVLAIQLAPQAHRRVKNAAHRIRTPMTHIARDAIMSRVETLEAKFRQEDEEKRLGKYEKRRAFGVSSLAPDRPNTPDEFEVEKKETEETAQLDSLYHKHAQRILEVLSTPDERRIRIAEAIAEVQSETPITEPSEDEIKKRLETEVLALRKQRSTATPTITTTPIVIPPPAAREPVIMPLLPALRIPSRFDSSMTGKTLPGKVPPGEVPRSKAPLSKASKRKEKQR